MRHPSIIISTFVAMTTSTLAQPAPEGPICKPMEQTPVNEESVLQMGKTSWFFRPGASIAGNEFSSSGEALIGDRTAMHFISGGASKTFSQTNKVAVSAEAELLAGRDDQTACALISADELCVGLELVVAGLFANTHFDLMPNERLRPYVSVGLGPLYIWAKSTGSLNGTEVAHSDDGEWGYGYQGRTGIVMSTSSNLDVAFGYRYLGGEVSGNSVDIQTLEVGLSYTP